MELSYKYFKRPEQNNDTTRVYSKLCLNIFDVNGFKLSFLYPLENWHNSLYDIHKSILELDHFDFEKLKTINSTNIYSYITRVLYYYVSEIFGEEGNWVFVCEFMYGGELFYGLYKAGCYANFETSGEMVFYTSKTLDNLICYAFDDLLRKNIIGGDDNYSIDQIRQITNIKKEKNQKETLILLDKKSDVLLKDIYKKILAAAEKGLDEITDRDDNIVTNSDINIIILLANKLTNRGYQVAVNGFDIKRISWRQECNNEVSIFV